MGSEDSSVVSEHMLPHLKDVPQTSKFKGYLTVAAGICIHLFCGNIYLWGNVSNYVVSYFHFEKHDPDATMKLAVLVIPLSMVAQAFGNPVGAYF